MQPLSSAVEAREFETVRRGGYDADQVDEFLSRVAERVRELELQITAAHGKSNTLQRQIEGTKDAESAVEIAFLAAADAKHHLIEDAEKRAEGIVARARHEAAQLLGPHEELEERRKESERLLREAKTRHDSVDEEATELLDAARSQAERIVSEARRDALAAIEESKGEADDWIEQARNEHQRISLMLRGLKAAVREMLTEGENRSEALRLVLAEESDPVEPAPVRLPG